MQKSTINLQESKEEQLDVTKTSRKRRNPFNETKEDKARRQKKRARVIVRNINYKCTDEDLKNHFGQFGEVEEVNILKRNDGRLVGCAFVQFGTVNQATKAILKGNNKELKGRPVYIDWAIGKDQYNAQKSGTTKVKNEDGKTEKNVEQDDQKDSENKLKREKIANENMEEESEDDSEDDDAEDKKENSEKQSENDSDDDESDQEAEEESGDDVSANENDAGNDSDSSDNKKDTKLKNEIDKVKKQKHISNDVKEGCTVFLKNVHFDVDENDLRKLCRKYGPIYYAIINKEPISGHSKGTAFVKFKSKESADLCLQAGNELILMDQVIEPFPALSKEEVRKQSSEKAKDTDGKDSRNLYLAREGLIMSGSKAAEGVSASDMAKRHDLERIKTQVLKNLNRFVSRNRLSIHNLPVSYDNEKLREMAITYTGFKPHECRVMRENKITAEYPKGKSKGFGFLSFNTHQEALAALRKMNNNPNIFSNQNRPIVAFSIEDRAVHKIKEKRKLKSKLNNPTYKEKLEKRKEARKQKIKGIKFPKDDNKKNVQRQLKKLEESRHKVSKKESEKEEKELDNFVGTAAKQGTSLRMRSNKKINEQAHEHNKNVRENKRKQKQRKIRQIHLAERKAEIRPKQGKKVERDDLEKLVNKYKHMITGMTNESTVTAKKPTLKKLKSKRKKWYTGE